MDSIELKVGDTFVVDFIPQPYVDPRIKVYKDLQAYMMQTIEFTSELRLAAISNYIAKRLEELK